MTAEEVVKEITKDKKWYLPHYKQQNASAMIKRFYEGKLSFNKLLELFGNYGYGLSNEITWKRKTD